jgi:segregation and condensation protein B
MRIAEALLFASAEPLDEKDIEKRMPRGVPAAAVLDALKAEYAPRGVNLVRAGGKWMFRTAADLAWLLAVGEGETKRLSRAALETLAIVAYHQPVTRAEIEDIRGVAISKGTMDVLIETGWVRLRGRRRAPGRPVTYGTTEDFLLHFGLEASADLPGLDELKGAGLFDGRLPQGFAVPQPTDDPALAADEDPLEGEGPEDFGAPDEAAAAEAGDVPGTAAAEDAEAEEAEELEAVTAEVVSIDVVTAEIVREEAEEPARDDEGEDAADDAFEPEASEPEDEDPDDEI